MAEKESSEKRLISICLFNGSNTWGGGERWHYDTAQMLHKEQYSVRVITNRPSELYRRLKTTGVQVQAIKTTNLSFCNPLKVYTLYRFFKRHNIHTLILNLSADVKVAGLAAKLAGVPQIIYRRGLAQAVRNTWLNRFLFRKILTHLIVNSEATRRALLQHNSHLVAPQKITILYNGIDPKSYQHSSVKHGAKQDKILILGSAGRLVTQKGQVQLLEIAEILKARKVQFKLLLAGDGPLKNSLQQAIYDCYLEDEIELLGFVDNMPAFMQRLDVFLFPSLWEGFGYVLAEAMAAGLPVVAFDTSSNPEVVLHGQTGYLAPLGQLHTFADYIQRFQSNPALVQEFGQAGQAHIQQQFHIEQTTQQLLHLIA